MHLPIILLLTATMPNLLLAATPSNFKEFLGVLNNIVGLLIPIVFAITFLTISWGVVKAWIMHPDDTGEIEYGKRLIIIGIIALVIMSSIWGIVRMLQSGLFGD